MALGSLMPNINLITLAGAGLGWFVVAPLVNSLAAKAIEQAGGGPDEQAAGEGEGAPSDVTSAGGFYGGGYPYSPSYDRYYGSFYPSYYPRRFPYFRYYPFYPYPKFYGNYRYPYRYPYRYRYPYW